MIYQSVEINKVIKKKRKRRQSYKNMSNEKVEKDLKK